MPRIFRTKSLVSLLAASSVIPAAYAGSGMVVSLTPGKWLLTAMIRYRFDAIGRFAVCKLRNTTGGVDVSPEYLAMYNPTFGEVHGTITFSTFVTVTVTSNVEVFVRGSTGDGSVNLITDVNGNAALIAHNLP